MNPDTSPFKLIECFLEKIILENEDYIVGLSIGQEIYGASLNSYDGMMLTFVDSGCGANPHINIIHQLLLKFKESAGFTLERVIIEAKYGDVFYCRLHWKHKKQDIYNITGLGDALILQALSGSQMYITEFVRGQLEKFSSGGFMESYED